MSGDLNRRQFVRTSAAVSAGAILGLSLEEKVLAAHQSKKAAAKRPVASAGGMPAGKIGSLKISRCKGRSKTAAGGGVKPRHSAPLIIFVVS